MSTPFPTPKPPLDADTRRTARVASGLRRAQRVLTEGNEDQIGLLFRNTLSRDAAARTALYRSFETGFHLPVKTLQQLARLTLSRYLPESWSEAAMFTDDAAFSPDRVFLTFATTPVGEDVRVAAVNQARRLLLQGLIEPEYLTSLAGSTDGFGDELAVYMPERERSHRHAIIVGKGIKHQSEHGARRLAEAEAALAWIHAERDRLFANVWLPAMLSDAEAAEIANVPHGYLRELYPTQYLTGYMGYRVFMAGKRAVDW